MASHHQAQVEVPCDQHLPMVLVPAVAAAVVAVVVVVLVDEV